MRRARHLLAACLLPAFAACGGGGTPAASSTSRQTPSAEAETTIGDATVHVSAVPTSQLPASVARQYGIERGPKRILLLVNLRELGGGPAPAITASVTDLQEHTTAVDLREVHVAQADTPTVDYVGTVDASPPDTLRFRVTVRRGSATASVEMSRDVYPE